MSEFLSVRKSPVAGFIFRGFDHDDRIPRAAIQEGTGRALGDAFPAADTFQRIDFNNPEGGGAGVLNQDHALVYRTVGLANRGTGTTSAGLVDIRQYLGFLLSPSGLSRGHRSRSPMGVRYAEGAISRAYSNDQANS